VERFVTSAGADLVWRVLADVEHWRDWTPTVTEIMPLNGAALQVGARYRVVQPKLRPAIYEVIDYIPNRRFTWMQKIAGGSMIADHQIVPADGATEVELSFETRGLVANILGSIFSRMITDYVATEARSLKQRCEKLA